MLSITLRIHDRRAAGAMERSWDWPPATFLHPCWGLRWDSLFRSLCNWGGGLLPWTNPASSQPQNIPVVLVHVRPSQLLPSSGCPWKLPAAAAAAPAPALGRPPAGLPSLVGFKGSRPFKTHFPALSEHSLIQPFRSLKNISILFKLMPFIFIYKDRYKIIISYLRGCLISCPNNSSLSLFHRPSAAQKKTFFPC